MIFNKEILKFYKLFDKILFTLSKSFFFCEPNFSLSNKISSFFILVIKQNINWFYLLVWNLGNFRALVLTILTEFLFVTS